MCAVLSTLLNLTSLLEVRLVRVVLMFALLCSCDFIVLAHSRVCV